MYNFIDRHMEATKKQKKRKQIQQIKKNRIAIEIFKSNTFYRLQPYFEFNSCVTD